MPLAIDLFCGLGGWAEGLLAEGWDVVGFDIERHQYGAHRYPAQLVIQDVLTLHGSQFRDADLIVASPPCQQYSWMAMPWTPAKAKAAEIRADTTGKMLADLNRLFDACFQLQAQASLAAGRKIPLVVENVRGAQPWVGRARWNFGSFYLWGDVPALMPMTGSAKLAGFRFDGSGRSFQSESVKDVGCGANIEGIGWTGFANPGWRDYHTASGKGQNLDGRKGVPHRPAGHWTNPDEHSGVKHQESGHAWYRTGPSSSPRRKAASAMIAKIPPALARHIAAVYHD